MLLSNTPVRYGYYYSHVLGAFHSFGGVCQFVLGSSSRLSDRQFASYE